MCEHKNLRTVGDRLFCKDCKAELPIEFLTKDEKPADVVIDAAAVKIEPAEVMEEQTVIEPAEDAQEAAQEAAQDEQEAGQNAPDDAKPATAAPKKRRAKTARKTGKNGGV